MADTALSRRLVRPEDGSEHPARCEIGGLADQLAGGRTIAEPGRSFGLDRRLANTVTGIDPEDVKRIERGLPRLFNTETGIPAAVFGRHLCAVSLCVPGALKGPVETLAVPLPPAVRPAASRLLTRLSAACSGLLPCGAP